MTSDVPKRKAGKVVLVSTAVVLGACATVSSSMDSNAYRGAALHLNKDQFRPGEVVRINIVTDSTMDLRWGLVAYLERRQGNQWKRVFYLVSPLAGEGEPTYFPARAGPPLTPLVGFSGDGTQTVRLPLVSPGRYRIGKQFVTSSQATAHMRRITSHVEMRVVPPEE